MNLYLLKTSRGRVYYVVADTMMQALAVQSISEEVVLSCEITATSTNSGDIANYSLPKLVITK